ncbi:MAG TPA: APC family permease [Candidatus Acidoferrum sp.]|nr:APC family permease [Candidatus Acidoferrum sp.]
MPLPADTSSADPSTLSFRLRRDRGKLLQILGVGFGIAVAVGNAISAGIVRTPGDIAARLPNHWLFFSVWFLGAFYALVSAFQLAELGSAIPKSGGQYNFSRRALGDYAGFIVGWSDWLSTCGTTGAVGIVVGEYIAHIFPIMDGAMRIKITAVSVIVFFALLQWRSISMGSKVQNFTTVLKGLVFFVMVIACFTMGGHVRHAAEAAPLAQAAASIVIPVGAALIAAFLFGIQATIYTYDGWDGVIYFGDEIKNPGYLVPRAIFASLFSIVAIYLLINAAVLYVLPMSEIAGNNFSLGLAAQRVFGPHGDTVFRSIMVLALFSSLNALHLMGARVIYAMSRDGLFFRGVSRINKGGTPTLGLLLSALVGVAFAVFSFERVIAMLAFFFVTNYLLSFTSMFLLRLREPGMPRPYRAWGYPWTTALALLGSIGFLIEAVREDRTNSIFTLIALACSYPVYRVLKLVSSGEAKNEAI